jgi:hypothetical protein
MEKSLVGDPVLWPGLVYAPLNNAGLIFALGTIINSTDLLFEEFSADLRTAICRRKTDAGWERIKVAFAVHSSNYQAIADNADLLICWVDDAQELVNLPRLALSSYIGKNAGIEAVSGPVPVDGLDGILPNGAAADLMARGQSRESYEETVRLLDEQIKKLQNG